MQFLLIARAMNAIGPDGMWDEEDGFYYDVLRLPDGSATRLKVRSMVGLLPLCATTVIEKWQRERVPETDRGIAVIDGSGCRNCANPSMRPGPGHLGVAERGIFGLVNETRLRRILTRMLDENEFLSPYGIRSLSRYHAEHPYVFSAGGQEYRVDYLPAESDTGMFGGNSNWRGPIWMPVNALIIRALLHYYAYYGDNFKIECPTGSGNLMNLFEVAREIANRLTAIFLRDDDRPPAGLWRNGEIPERSALAGSSAVLRIFPWRQRRRYRRQPSDRMDRVRRHADRALRQARCRGFAEGFPRKVARTGAVEKLTPVRF